MIWLTWKPWTVGNHCMSHEWTWKFALKHLNFFLEYHIIWLVSITVFFPFIPRYLKAFHQLNKGIFLYSSAD